MATFGDWMPTILNVTSTLSEGRAADAAKKFQAQQYDRLAKQSTAVGSRNAYEAARRGEEHLSNIRAAMAAGGGSTTDAGAISRLGKAAAETDYNILAALYEGDTRADTMALQAEANRWEGKMAKKKARTKGFSTVLTGASDIYGDKMWSW
jgi:hypothetical protein